MNMCCRILLFLTVFFNFQSLSAGATDKPAAIVPNLRPYMNQVVQPFDGEMAFARSPKYAQVCSVTVNVTGMRKIDADEVFRIQKQDAYGFDITPDTSIWRAPIDSGATMKMIFTFRPEQVGTYHLSFGRRLKRNWIVLASLMLAIDEDGKTIYAGEANDYRLNLVPPHAKRNADSLIVRFPLKKATFDYELDRHFTATFKFTPPPKLNETTFVDFELECWLNLYSKVQFVLDYANTMRVSELPASWGDSAGPNENYRFYRGRFAIVPQKAGIGYFDFKVIGKRPLMKQSERVTTDFPVYYVIGKDNSLLFIGSFDPWVWYKDKTDALLGSAAALVDVKEREFRLKPLLSQPDYIGQETEAAEKQNSKGK